jgi:hypothetical protein
MCGIKKAVNTVHCVGVCVCGWVSVLLSAGVEAETRQQPPNQSSPFPPPCKSKHNQRFPPPLAKTPIRQAFFPDGGLLGKSAFKMQSVYNGWAGESCVLAGLMELCTRAYGLQDMCILERTYCVIFQKFTDNIVPCVHCQKNENSRTITRTMKDRAEVVWLT